MLRKTWPTQNWDKCVTIWIDQVFKGQPIDKNDFLGDDEVEVKMPKFTLETTTDLKDTLEKLGMKKMFDSTGFLTEIAHQPLAIGAAKHKVRVANRLIIKWINYGLEVMKIIAIPYKVKIIVDEKGTEAAAATGMIAMMRLAPMPVMVYADHPFLFFIRHNDQTLFGGRFTSPQ